MGLRVYIIVEEYGTEVYQISIIGAVIDEETAKEIVNTLNEKEKSKEDYDKDFSPSYIYFCQEVYGTVENFMKGLSWEE